MAPARFRAPGGRSFLRRGWAAAHTTAPRLRKRVSNDSPSQVWNYRWPGGTDEQIAILSARVDTLARLFGFSPEEWEEDGLGPARGFWCKLQSGHVFSLIEFAQRPSKALQGPNLSVDSQAYQLIGGETLLHEVLDALGLTDTDVAWVRPAE